MLIYPKDFGSNYSDHVSPNGCTKAEHCCIRQAVERLEQWTLCQRMPCLRLGILGSALSRCTLKSKVDISLASKVSAYGSG